MMAFDGNSLQPIWECNIPHTESYSTPVPGRFNEDMVPDFISLFNKGTWPDNKGSVQVIVNGRNGEILFRDTLGCMGYSSPITVDWNGDGFDEAVYSVNRYVCNPPSFYGEDIINSSHELHLLDYHHQSNVILLTSPGKNISSTPWVGDMQQDGLLDVVYSYQRNQFKVDQYDGIVIECLSTDVTASPTWNSYLNEKSDGIFSKSLLHHDTNPAKR